MSVKLLDEAAKTLEEEEFLPVFDYQSGIVPRSGTTVRPPVVLAGIDEKQDVTLDLVNPGMTEDRSCHMDDFIFTKRSPVPNCVPLFPIAPLFLYGYLHAYSPEVRLVVTFKGLEVTTVEKVKKVDCTVSAAERPREGSLQ
jgi:hypothetical protein